MSQYLLEINSEHEKLSCAALQADIPGLGLDEYGITWQNENAPAKIDVFEGELRIARNVNFEGQIAILRGGRERMLRPGQSIRLLTQDEIRIDAQKFEIGTVMKSCTPRFERIFQSFRTATRALMLTSAAALILTACSPSNTKVNEDSNDVSVVNEVGKMTPDENVPDMAPSEIIPEPAPEVIEELAGEVEAEPEIVEPEIVEPEIVEVNDHPGACKGHKENAAPADIADDNKDGSCALNHEGCPLANPNAPKLPAPDAECSNKSGEARRKCCESLGCKQAKRMCCDKIKDSEFPCRVEPKKPVNAKHLAGLW